jgi:Tol biopolymer transport system component
VSPNGKTIAFERVKSTGEIFTADMNGKHARWITKTQSTSGGNWLSFHSPTWSPNGKKLAFQCNTFDFNQICVTDAKGGTAKVLYHCNCALGEPDWGKSNKIVFQHGNDLWELNTSGKPHAHKLPITHLSSNDSAGYAHPSWSPDGKTIAFSVGSVNESIDTVDANGKNHKRLIVSPDFGTDPTDYDYPAWAPDGKSIALHVTGNGPKFGGKPEGLYTMNTLGGALTKRSSAVQGQYPELFWATKPK